MTYRCHTLLIFGLVSASCGVPQDQYDAKQAEVEALTETLNAANEALNASTQKQREHEEAINTTLEQLNAANTACTPESSGFGPQSWYAADPIYREWRSKAVYTIDDIDASYKDPTMVNRFLRAYHAAYPTVTALHTLGITHQGREILALNITNFEVDDTKSPPFFERRTSWPRAAQHRVCL